MRSQTVACGAASRHFMTGRHAARDVSRPVDGREARDGAPRASRPPRRAQDPAPVTTPRRPSAVRSQTVACGAASRHFMTGRHATHDASRPADGREARDGAPRASRPPRRAQDPAPVTTPRRPSAVRSQTVACGAASRHFVTGRHATHDASRPASAGRPADTS
ncbi:hypothetical protein DEJ35_07830 [Curtobacterium sp. MCPF17_051]|nr:hypothetical protein DEJ35_07830 [Curtobacterium sp. MCPF17_051]